MDKKELEEYLEFSKKFYNKEEADKSVEDSIIERMNYEEPQVAEADSLKFKITYKFDIPRKK